MRAIQILSVLSVFMFFVCVIAPNPSNISTATPGISQHKTKTNIKAQAFFTACGTRSVSFDTNANLNAINCGVIGMLILKMRIWMSMNSSVDKINYYLGYAEKYVSVINRAITRIAFTQRPDTDDELNLDDTIALFYDTCDIKNTTGSDAIEIEFLKSKFREYFQVYNMDEALITDNDTLDYFADIVIENIEIIGDVNSPLNVSIPLMKNMQYLDEFKDCDFNKLKNMPVTNSNKNLRELVESYLIETDWQAIEKNHLHILRLVAPEVFSYIYDYFDILIKLANYDNNENVWEEIQRIRNVTYVYMTFFLTRIIEFQLKYMDDKDDAKKATDMIEQIDMLARFTNPDLHSFGSGGKKLDFYISDYHGENNKKDVQNYMSNMLHNTTDKLLKYFGRNVNEWKDKRVLRLNGSNTDDKNVLLNLLKKNNNNAIDTLKKFAKYYVTGFENTTESTDFLKFISESLDTGN